MVRNLAHGEGQDVSRPSDSTPPESGNKFVLNRREYVLLGAATATMAGAGLAGRASGADEQTFTTDFSEYAV